MASTVTEVNAEGPKAADVMSGLLSPVHYEIFAKTQPPVPSSRWSFGEMSFGSDDLVAIGADLDVDTLVQAYIHGLFPMPMDRRDIGWWCPLQRGVIPLDGLRISKSLRKSCRKYSINVDTCFEEVMKACGDPNRPHGWITQDFIDAYVRLHQAGWAHSVEVFYEGDLVGGVYGVHIGRLFAGESMFHTRTDGSKVALVALVALLRGAGVALFDVQWTTPHLISMGAIEIPRAEYLRRLAETQNDPSSRQTAEYG